MKLYRVEAVINGQLITNTFYTAPGFSLEVEKEYYLHCLRQAKREMIELILEGWEPRVTDITNTLAPPNGPEAKLDLGSNLEIGSK